MIKEVRYWETEDGARFYSEEEAQEHEVSLLTTDELIFYDSLGERIDSSSSYNGVYYIEVRSEFGIETLNRIASEYWEIDPEDTPKKIGIYQYNEEKEKWLSAKEWIENECKNWAVQVDWGDVFSSVKV